jgi:hypothetical protein
MITLKEFSKWLEEESVMQNGFSIEELRKISAGKPSERGLKATIDYLTKTLGKPTHSGSSRAVWAISNTEVLKVGLNFEELDQNKKEVKIIRCIGNAYAPNLIDFHPGYYWLLLERVQPVVNEAQFVELFSKSVGMELKPRMNISGIDSNVALVITNLIGGFQTKTYRSLLDSFNQSPWFKELMNRIRKCRMDPGDLHYENWGVREGTRELVILDFGF